MWGIIIILAILCVLFATNKINLNDSVEDSKDTEEVGNNISDEEIDTKKLYSIGEGEFTFIKRIYYGDNSFGITPDGRVLIGFDNYINGVNKAKDIIIFDNILKGTTLYILDYNGQLYQYDLKNIEANIFEVEKNEKYNNVRRIFEYQTLKKNAGGCMRLIIIDNNNNYQEIDSNCV